MTEIFDKIPQQNKGYAIFSRLNDTQMSWFIELSLENDNAFSFEMASIFDEISEQNKFCHLLDHYKKA